MRIAIFSDIHGNRPALTTVLADIEQQQVDRVYCLGDLVGYAAFPNEVVARIRESGIPTIIGNYDDGVGFDRDECGCAYRDPEEERRGQQSLMYRRDSSNRAAARIRERSGDRRSSTQRRDGGPSLSQRSGT
jgi:hypothetical protein